MGCSFLFPREIFERLGGLDEDFVFYCEEMEFCYRLGKKGYEIWVVPEAIITHLGVSSWDAAKRMGDAVKLEVPNYWERRFLYHQKTSGVGRKINSNRLRIFLYSALAPGLQILRSRKLTEVREKIQFHREENRNYRKLLARDADRPQGR